MAKETAKGAYERGVMETAAFVRDLLTADPTISTNRSPTSVRALVATRLRERVRSVLGAEAVDNFAWHVTEVVTK
jgi:hypothetical protein